jgi:hypothetical protein
MRNLGFVIGLMLNAVIAFGQTTVTTGNNKYVVLEASPQSWSGFTPDAYCIEDGMRSNNKLIIVNNHNNNATSIDSFKFLSYDQWDATYIGATTPLGTIDRKPDIANNIAFSRTDWVNKINARCSSYVYYQLTMTVKRIGQQLSVFLSGKSLANQSGEYRFNVMITEDSLLQNQANNYTSGSCSYMSGGNPLVQFPHRDVLRAYLGTEWGIFYCYHPLLNQIDTMTFNYSIPKSFNINKLRVIGLVQKYNSSNQADREVINAISLNTLCSPSTSNNITNTNNGRVCDSILLSSTKSASCYIWYKDGVVIDTTTINSKYFKTSGKYQMKAIDGFGCALDTSNTITVVRFDDEKKPQICSVSVDSATGKNEIIWEKYGITRATQYNIYRENSSSQFVLIGTKAPNLFSTFIDTGSYPLQQAYRYKITLIDSCNVETPVDSSVAHKTVHLTSNVGISGEVNLIWNLYEGKLYSSHDIMRSVNSGPFVSIANVPNNITSYSDLTPPSGKLTYRIDLSTTGCTPTAKNTSYSAISSNSVVIFPTKINSLSKDIVTIYPNPTNGKVTITNSCKITKVEIANLLGQKLFSETHNTNKVIVDISSFEKGVYFIKVNDGYTEKLVKE